MSRMPFALAARLLLTLLLAACSSPAADRGAAVSTTTLAESSPRTAVVPAPASPQVRIWGAGFATSYPFSSFAGWVRDAMREATGGVALVQIVDVSGVRWSTATGEKPSPADIVRANRTGASIYIGRLVTVELVRMLRGTGPSAGSTTLYWRSGGQIGIDRTPDYAAAAGVPELRSGSLALADLIGTFDADEATDGVLPINVNVVFPVDDVGRVRTPWPDEKIMIDDIERYLPAP